MMVDPDGEFAFIPALIKFGAILAKGALKGGAIAGGFYTDSVALSDGGFNNWRWSDFGRAVGRGATAGAMSAGIGFGVSEGLKSMGVGSKRSKFAGGFTGNFAAGTYMNGGIPYDPKQLAFLLGASVAGGATYKNPNIAKATGNFSSPADFGDAILLPEVQIEALRLGNYPPWWGLTNLFTNPITRSISLNGFYNGNFNRFANIFPDNQTELRWRQFGNQYYPYQHINYISGTAPAVGGGGIANAGKGYQYTRSIGSKYHQYTKIVKAGKLPGQAKAEYTKIFNNKGKLIRMFKDSYKIDGRFYHRAPYHPRIPSQPRYIR
jgi:hypothetical protein